MKTNDLKAMTPQAQALVLALDETIKENEKAPKDAQRLTPHEHALAYALDDADKTTKMTATNGATDTQVAGDNASSADGVSTTPSSIALAEEDLLLTKQSLLHQKTVLNVAEGNDSSPASTDAEVVAPKSIAQAEEELLLAKRPLLRDKTMEVTTPSSGETQQPVAAADVVPMAPSTSMSATCSGSRAGAFLSSDGDVHRANAFDKAGYRPTTTNNNSPEAALSEEQVVEDNAAAGPAEDGGVPVADQINETERDEDDLEAAQQLDPDKLLQEQETKRQERHRYTHMAIALTVLATIVVGVVVSVAVALSQKDNDGKQDDTEKISLPRPEETPITTVPPTLDPISAFGRSLDLPTFSLQAMEESKISPQYRALVWLYQHPRLNEYPQWKQVQLFALVTFFYAMNGDHWPDQILTDWLDYDRDECFWFSDKFVKDQHDVWKNPALYERVGLTNATEICVFPDGEGEFGHYFHLGLIAVYGMSMVDGRVPAEISLLPFLQGYHIIASRHMDGLLEDLVPKELQNVNITSLHIWGNDNITGTIPEYIFNMEHLQEFWASKNQISGRLSSQIGQLTNLQWLEMEGNEFTGALPSELGLLTKLTKLILTNSHFSSDIPTEIWQMSSLKWLSLDPSDQGPFPSEVGQLSDLELLHIYGSPSEGTIPTELFQLTHMHTLWLQNNSFIGKLPTEIGMLSLLWDLGFLESPKLFGTIPTEIGMVENVEWMALHDTALSGRVPSEIGQLENLYGLVVHNTSLTGPVPQEVCDLPFLAGVVIDCDRMSCNCTGTCDGVKECSVWDF